MDESNIIKLEDFVAVEEDYDEILSLRGLVLTSGDDDDEDTVVNDCHHPNSPDPPDDIIRSSSEQLFEFLNNQEVSSEMSHAEDIIICGKLVPFKEPPAAFHSDHIVLKSDDPKRDEMLLSFHRKRSESMPEFKSSQVASCSSKNSLMRNSRSLDYQKMYASGSANSSTKSDKSSPEMMDRSSSIKTSGKNDGKPPGKSKWSVFLFGPGKFPLEMELQDIKSRQERRNPPGTLFGSILNTTDKECPDRRTDDRRSSSSWDILKILSCKDNTSVAVTASFGRLQHVR